MAAYVIAHVRVEDPELYEDYRAQVVATIEAHGGRFLARGGKAELLEGTADPARVVVLEFPSYERARAWYDSDEYRPLIELRQNASTGDLILVDGV
jgi:uncharacterized protein (DUF1330 family)